MMTKIVRLKQTIEIGDIERAPGEIVPLPDDADKSLVSKEILDVEAEKEKRKKKKEKEKGEKNGSDRPVPTPK